MAVGDLTVTMRSYVYEMEVDDYTAIEHRDDEMDHWEDTLCVRLEALDGVSRVDYNGHFGANIFFNIDTDDDTPKLRETIVRMIVDYVMASRIEVADNEEYYVCNVPHEIYRVQSELHHNKCLAQQGQAASSVHR